MCREEAAKNNLPIYVELRCGDLIRYVSYPYRFSNLQGSESSEEAHTLVDFELPDWQITKFICFLIQNIYCQTAHKSRGVAPKRAPKCLDCLGLLGLPVFSVGSTVQERKSRRRCAQIA